MVRNGAIYTLHTDHLGRPEKATDASGATVWSIQANAWGSDAPGGALTVNLRFPGQYYDAESGLYYNYHRFYDPVTGKLYRSYPNYRESIDSITPV